MKIRNFFDLDSWKEAHSLSLEIYKTTRQFPRIEVYGLISQLRRSSVSVSSNIAEGFSRQSHKEKVQFYYLALGSLTEVQSQIWLAVDLDYLAKSEFKRIFDQTVVLHKLINGLIKSARSRNTRDT